MQQNNNLLDYDKIRSNKLVRENVHRLYHSYKNENALLYAILLSLPCFILTEGISLLIFIWIYYFIYCKKNNHALDRDPNIQKERKYYLEKYNMGREV